MVTNSNLSFLHSFEQGTLNFGRCPVNFICQEKVGKDGPLFGGEFSFARAVYKSAHNIGWQEVGGKLDSFKVRFDTIR